MHHPPSKGAIPPRPLSPHLQIYRPQLTSLLSIMHRLSGLMLSFGLLFIVLWLFCLCEGETSYRHFLSFMDMMGVKIFLFAWSLALFFHLFNGVRHLFWDIGWGFELSHVYRSGYAVLILTVMAMLLFWGGLQWN